MNIGQAIRIIRQTKFSGLSQQGFAKSIGITQTYQSPIENSQKQASTEVLQKIADVCEIPLPILFWFAIEKSDLPPNKAKAFDIIKPSIDAMINTLIITNGN